MRITHPDGRVIVLADQHRDYVPGVREHFDDYWGAVVVEGDTVDFSRPALHTYRRTGLRFWIPAMPEEDTTFDGLFRHARPNAGDLVFDLGAHAGATTYELSRMVGPSGRVVAFEPDPVAFGCLVKNVDALEIRNVVAVPMALAGSAHPRVFNLDGATGAAFADLVERNGRVPVSLVDTLTLADAFARYGVPTFIKMDIEGAELEVLEAAQDVLATHRPALAIDTHHRVGGEYTSERVEAVLAEIGYRTETALSGGWHMTWAWVGV